MAATSKKFQGSALVTGASHRIGEAIALKLSSLGFAVALHYNSSKAEAKRLKEVIAGAGGVCEIFPCNLSDTKKTAQLIPQVLKKFSNLSLLVNNASVFKPDSFASATISSLDEHMNVHVKAPFILMQQFVKRCKRGQIINILDTCITKNKTDYFAYLLSKKTLSELTKMVAVEVAPHIRVNAIAPGLILPPAGKSSSYLQKRSRMVPLKKVGNVQNILQSVEFLLTNDYLTGQVLFNDGGEYLM